MDLVRRRPLLSFFTLAFGLTWLAWTPFLLSRNGLGVLPFRMSETLGILPAAYLGPLTAALTVTAIADGRAGLRRWGARLIRWRFGPRWYAGVLLGTPLLLVAGTFALPGAAGALAVPSAAVFLGYPVLLVVQTLTTGLAEEPGWRDFATPRLQRRYGPLRANLILGPLWGVWHLPLFATEWAGQAAAAWSAAVEFVAAAVSLSIVMTWVFNRTAESLPVVMLLHAGVNTTFTLLWPALFPALDPDLDSLHVLLITATIAAVALLVATRGRLGYRLESPGADAGTSDRAGTRAVSRR
jgi:uncharacterized protein